MYQTITKSMFHDAFRDYDRLDNFSYEARNALFDYLEEYEESSGQSIELDVIALCCDYAEDTIENVLAEYSLESIEELEENTTVIWMDETHVLYANY